MASSVKLPSISSLEKGFEILTEPDAANFLYQRCEEQFTKAKVKDEFGELLKDIKYFANSIGENQANSEAWTGNNPVVKSQLAKYQDFLAKDSVQSLDHHDIEFHYALSDDSEIIRSYIDENGQELSDEESKEMDTIFNAWLAEKDLQTKDGIICQTDASDENTQANNQKNKEIAEEIREEISDEKNGIAAFAKKLDDSVDIKVIEHEHPNDALKREEAAGQGPATSSSGASQ